MVTGTQFKFNGRLYVSSASTAMLDYEILKNQKENVYLELQPPNIQDPEFVDCTPILDGKPQTNLSHFIWEGEKVEVN